MENNMYGIFNKVDKELTGLSTEALEYGIDINAINKASASDMKDVALLMESVDIAISVESKVVVLDNQLTDISRDNYVGMLTDISSECMKLYGTDNKLSTELANLAELAMTDLQLSVEEYEKKRNSVIDQLIRKIWDGLENIVSGDSWMSGFSTVENLFTSERKKLEQIQVYTKELSSGVRVIKKDAKLSNTTKRMLGVYMCREKEFTFKRLHTQLEECYKLFTAGLIDKGLADVHDSLVQSVGEEVNIVTDKDSLAYVRSFKRLDLPEVDITSIKMAVPVHVVDSTFSVLTIVQDSGEGIDFEHVNRKIPEDLYSDIKIGTSSTKDMMVLGNLLLKIIPELRKQTNKKDSKRVLTDFVKSIRSRIATVIYGHVFSIFAIRRVIRQVYLANKYITSIIGILIDQYAEWTKVAELHIRLIEELTEIK